MSTINYTDNRDNFLNTNSTEGQRSVETVTQKKSNLSGVFRMLMFIGALTTGIGLANNVNASPVSPKSNSVDLMKRLVNENGYKYAGKIEGGAIMCGEGDSPEEAKKSATKNSESLLGTTELTHKFTQALPTNNGKWVVCAISKKKDEGSPDPTPTSPQDIEKEKNQKMEKLIKDFGYRYAGINKDGSVIGCGEGANEFEALNKAIEVAKLFKPNISLRIGEYKKDTLSNGNYVVVLQAWQVNIVNGVKILNNSEKLKVNTDKTHYKISKSREEGEDDLFDLCKSADKEESWIYVIRKDGEETWNENGFNEKNGKASVDLTPMKQIVRGQSKISGISFYHHHPIDTSSSEDRSQTPSRIDITGFIRTMKIIAKQNPELLNKLDFRVATSTGIYVFKFSPAILKNKTYLKRVYKLAAKLGRERMMFPNFDYRRKNSTNYHIENIKFTKKFSSPLMDIRFRPNQEALSKKPAQVKITNLHRQFRDSETSVLYSAYYVPQMKKIILKGYQVTSLYDGFGNRIGHVKENGQWATGVPEKGWPEGEGESINLNDYARKEIKKLKKEYTYFR